MLKTLQKKAGCEPHEDDRQPGQSTAENQSKEQQVKEAQYSGDSGREVKLKTSQKKPKAREQFKQICQNGVGKTVAKAKKQFKQNKRVHALTKAATRKVPKVDTKKHKIT